MNQCPNCGNHKLYQGVKFGSEYEVGLGYRKGTGLLKSMQKLEKIVCDLCGECGTIVRLYVKNANRDWIKE